MEGRASRAACIALLFCVPFALSGINLDDYFVGDDFDFLVSMHGEPAWYFVERLWDNESGDVWSDAGFDSALGHGYLRPVKIWLLKLNQLTSGTSPFGYHLTSTLVFSGLVVAVFLLIEALLPGRRHYALLGAGAVAVHPTFAEVVPFVTARDEALAALFGVASLLAFVRFRTSGRSPLPFYVLYALALLSKESAFPVAGVALLYDVVLGPGDPRTREGRSALLRAHGPVVLLLAGYFGLRLVAFGNFKGGDVGETTFTSPQALLRFHAAFFRSLVAPSQLALPWPRAVGAAVALGAAAATALLLARDRRRFGPLLLFTGPVWYLGATALLHGTYFTTRHHGMAVIGLALFGTTLLAGVTERLSLRVQHGIAALLGLVAALAFVPPAYGLARSYDAAAGVVARVRAAIDAATRDLPDGCVVRIENVPQWTERPWYFGWGLRSALSRPFTPGDLANRCTVVNERNLALTGARIEIPERYDRVIDLAVVPEGAPPRAPSRATPAPREGASVATPRRIVLVSLDTVRADRMRPGSANAPELTRIAATGVWLPRFYAASSYTIPSHMSLFTGLDPVEHGVTRSEATLAPGVATLAEILRDAGYRTRAFHEGGYVAARFGFDRGFERYEALPRQALVGDGLPRVLDWMRDQGDAPYFLFLHTYAAHFPFGGFEDYRAASPERDLPTPDEVEALRRRFPGFPSETPAADRGIAPETFALCTLYNQLADARADLLACGAFGTAESFPRGPHFEADVAAVRRAYDARIRQVDALLGRLRDALARQGQWQDTLLVVTSDHGEAFFEHGHYKHGYVPFDEVLRVPLVVSWPRGLGDAGRVVEGLAWHLDLLPTLAGLAGAPAPDGLAGRDLSPVLRGRATIPAGRTLLPAVLELAHREPRPLRRAVVRGGWKWIEGSAAFGDAEGLLFDLRADPGESRDLREQRPRRSAALAAAARRWSASLRPATAASQRGDLTGAQRDRLRALGYAQ